MQVIIIPIAENFPTVRTFLFEDLGPSGDLAERNPMVGCYLSLR